MEKVICVCEKHNNKCENKLYRYKNYIFCCFKGFKQSLEDFAKSVK